MNERGEAAGVAGVVVLYQPAPEVWDNLASYAPHLDRLYVVDNTLEPSDARRRCAEAVPGAECIASGSNLGIAAALNLAARKASDAGYRWLLTMDQDSRFADGDFARFLAAASREDAGILSPRHALDEENGTGPGDGWEAVDVVMTSGNLLSLAVWAEAGPFHEPLFIDYVDHEYCRRLATKGFPVRRHRGIALRHSLGSLRVERRFGLAFRPTHHDPLRRYYMARNRLYVMARYPRAVLPEAWAWAKELGKLLFFETRRREKLRYMGRGILDYWRGRFGPYEPTP